MKYLAALLFVFVTPAFADSVIEVETPVFRRVYSECSPAESHISRHGTVATVIADCVNRSMQLQVPGWAPDPHPDGLALRLESRLVVTLKSQDAFLQCELTDYAVTPFGSSQRWQCVDDPLAGTIRGR